MTISEWGARLPPMSDRRDNTILGMPNLTAPGELTEEEFWGAVEPIFVTFGRAPAMMVTSQRTIEKGQDAGLRNAGVARWCWAREAEMPRWAWRRRARLRKWGIEAAEDAEVFWATFGVGDVR